MITVGTTTHFAVQYDETITSNGQQLGQGLLQTCEGDYATLRDIFGGVDPPAPIRVTVDNGAGGAENRHDIIHDGDAGQGAAGDFDYLRNAFVAELAELFMYAQNRKWNPGDSKGEALSRVLGGFLYPGGQQPGFTVHQWVDNLPDGLNPSEDQPTGPEGLEDWITKVDGNDTRAKSIGCGVAFIHYLHYQLGFPFSQIVGTSGDTLEDVCQALTGTSGAFQPFADLVRATYPAGHPSGLNASSKFPDSDVLFRYLTGALVKVWEGEFALGPRITLTCFGSAGLACCRLRGGTPAKLAGTHTPSPAPAPDGVLQSPQ